MTDFKQNNPFKIPDGYFEKLEESLCNSEDPISKLNPFSVAENYFEHLEHSVLQKTLGTTQAPKKTSKKTIYSLVLTSAASILLFLGLFQQITPSELEKEQALNEFIESYYLEDFDSYDMLSMMEDIDMETTFDQIIIP
jgi:hypothetical protein